MQNKDERIDGFCRAKISQNLPSDVTSYMLFFSYTTVERNSKKYIISKSHTNELGKPITQKVTE